MVAFSFAACATTTPAAHSLIPLLGNAHDLQQLDGVWRATVTFPDRRVVASLEFRDDGVVADGELSSFHYIRMDGTTLLSAAGPAFDPACRCTVYTTMRLVVDGDTFSGEVRRLENRSRVVVGTLAATRTVNAASAANH